MSRNLRVKAIARNAIVPDFKPRTQMCCLYLDSIHLGCLSHRVDALCERLFQVISERGHISTETEIRGRTLLN